MCLELDMKIQSKKVLFLIESYRFQKTFKGHQVQPLTPKTEVQHKDHVPEVPEALESGSIFAISCQWI